MHNTSRVFHACHQIDTAGGGGSGPCKSKQVLSKKKWTMADNDTSSSLPILAVIGYDVCQP